MNRETPIPVMRTQNRISETEVQMPIARKRVPRMKSAMVEMYLGPDMEVMCEISGERSEGARAQRTMRPLSEGDQLKVVWT